MNEHYGTILFEDEEIIVVKKQAGVAVEAAGSERDLLTELKTLRLSRGEAPEVFLVHRLDQPVEGVLVAAKTEAAALALSECIQNGKLKKKYLAVVHGRMEERAGTLVNFLGKQKAVAYVSPTEQPGTKKAELSYEMLTEKDGYSLLLIRLLTGRFHQIRVQFSHAGHPIVGDRKYGKETEDPGVRFPALCATELIFPHPKTGEKMHFCVRPEGKTFALFVE